MNSERRKFWTIRLRRAREKLDRAKYALSGLPPMYAASRKEARMTGARIACQWEFMQRQIATELNQ